MYQLDVHVDSADVNKELKENEDLQIRTHYENLDIAKSNRIHYLKFSIPNDLDPTRDEELATRVREIESTEPEAANNEEKEIN
jgi:tRNA (guanine-N7-)-methyltransferase